MIKRVVLLLLLAVVILLAPLLIAFGELVFTQAKVAEVHLTKYYLLKLEGDESEQKLFDDYMRSLGYEGPVHEGVMMEFTRGQERKEVRRSDIKTVLRDGKLSTDFTSNE